MEYKTLSFETGLIKKLAQIRTELDGASNK